MRVWNVTMSLQGSELVSPDSFTIDQTLSPGTDTQTSPEHSSGGSIWKRPVNLVSKMEFRVMRSMEILIQEWNFLIWVLGVGRLIHHRGQKIKVWCWSFWNNVSTTIIPTFWLKYCSRDVHQETAEHKELLSVQEWNHSSISCSMCSRTSFIKTFIIFHISPLNRLLIFLLFNIPLNLAINKSIEISRTKSLDVWTVYCWTISASVDIIRLFCQYLSSEVWII